jgi:signal transduction histidine kinase
VFDVLLVDLGLPDATGLEIVTRLRAHAPASPVLVLTGNSDDRLAVRAVGANAQDYLVKWDFNEHVLVRSIRQAIEREQMEQRLRHAKRQAENANLSKSHFLAVMGHEIRTPMNTVLGMADLLAADDGLNERQRERLDRLCRAGNHMLRLIDDLLDLSRIEAGRLELEHVPFDLDQLLSRTLELVQPTAAAKGVALTSHRAPDVRVSLTGDPHRVRQILLNLLANALKFTPAGRVEVRVEREPTSDTPGALRFIVSDTGVGIPPDRIAHVFSSFVQADASTSRKYGGAGLGLNIAKGLAEAMGGGICVESTVGEGTTFTVLLTLGVEAHDAALVDDIAPRLLAPEHLARALSFRSRRVRVLLVDDCADNHALVEGYLGEVATVVHASTAARAFLELGQHPVDVILMDMHLPLMNGFEATRAIRAAERANCVGPVPIIAVTADALKSSVDRATQAGCTAYLAKPLRREALLRAICEHVSDEPSPFQAPPVGALPDPGVARLMPRFLSRRQEDVRTMRIADACSRWGTT